MQLLTFINVGKNTSNLFPQMLCVLYSRQMMRAS